MTSLKSITSTINKGLKNTAVLYIITFIAVINIIGYLANNNIRAVTFFVLLGYVLTFFTKNMTVVLLTAIIFTNFYIGSEFYIEGMKERNNSKNNGDDDDDEDADKDVNIKALLKQAQKKNGNGGSNSNADDDDEEDDEEDDDKGEAELPDDFTSNFNTEGLNAMSKQTEGLLRQQEGLTKAIKNMEPTVDKALEMMTKMGLNKKDVKNMIGNMNKQ
jgi:hypothetical protein